MTDEMLFFRIFSGDNWELSENLISSNNWSSIVVIDVLSLQEFERISCALKSRGIDNLVCLSRGGSEITDQDCEVVSNDEGSLLNILNSKSALCVAFTTKNTEFVLFKDDANEYYILAGRPDFIAEAYGKTFENAKKDFAYEIDGMRDQAKVYFNNIWNKYSASFDFPNN